MSNLTLAEKLIFTRVKRAAVVWLLMLRIDPQPLTEALAAEILQIDRSTARGYLRTLNELEITTRLGRFEGYQLSESGRQMTLPLELRRLQAFAREEIPPSELNAFNEFNDSLKDSLNTSLKALIKSEGGNSPFDGGNSPLAAYPMDNIPNSVDKSGINEGISIDEQIDQILEAHPEKRAILEELLFCRIKINWKTIALLYNDELTIGEIKSQYKFLESKGMAKHTGILIENLLSKYKPRGEEFDPDTGHPLECECFKCVGSRNRRYIESFNDWEDDNENE